jgi:hypothetical protein
VALSRRATEKGRPHGVVPSCLCVLLLCACARAPEARSAPPPPAEFQAWARGGVLLSDQPEYQAVETCANARDDNHNRLIDEGCGSPIGDLQIALAWEGIGVDLDLLVRGPDGAIARVGEASPSGLVRDQDCKAEEGQGCTVERVTFEPSKVGPKRLRPGRYQVHVRWGLSSLANSDAAIAVLGVSYPGATRSYALRLDQVGAEAGVAFDVSDLEGPGPVPIGSGAK